jgi:Fur family transcriptional regulator, ferric uptake regulator
MNEITALLHASGLKATPARQSVLQLLLTAPRPMSHAEIDAQLKRSEGKTLDRVTLYRVLVALTDCGLFMKAVDAHGVSRFAPSEPKHQHDSHVHFRCTGCGGVFCLDAVPPLPPKLPHGFRLESVEFDVQGICANCHSSTIPQRLST